MTLICPKAVPKYLLYANQNHFLPVSASPTTSRCALSVPPVMHGDNYVKKIRMQDPEIASRCIRYDFGASFLRFATSMFYVSCSSNNCCSRKSIGAKLVFKVGEDPLPGFRMIERHYFKDQLIKSFDFTLGFCMSVWRAPFPPPCSSSSRPNSTNEWEVMYTVPSTTEELRNAM